MPLLLLGGYLIPFDRSAQDPTPITSAAEEQYRELPSLPTGESGRGRAGVERSAIELAAALRGVPLSDALDPCPEPRLRVVWEAPGESYRHGALLEPVGPAPDAATEQVNGAVVCDGSGYGYMGFEATWAGTAWSVVAVPFLDESDEHVHEEPAPAPLPASAPALPTLDRTFSAAIEGYAAYEPQRTCDPTPKTGTVSLQRMLLNGNPGSRNLGISRGCSIGGQSEHKEGRAFDWGVYVSNARERAQADAFIERIMATDAQGNRHALARRMGVMYVIWNKRIWSSYRASAGWRPYSGASPHTDHIHISLSWAGALGRTSFWSGTVPGELLAMPSVATVPVSASRTAQPPASPPRPAEPSRRIPRQRGAGGPSPDLDAERREAREAQRRAWQERMARLDQERRQQREAAEEVWRERRDAAEQARREQREAAEQARREQREAAEQARREQREAADQAGREQGEARDQHPRRRRGGGGGGGAPAPAAPAPAAPASEPRVDRDAERARRAEAARKAEADRRAAVERRIREAAAEAERRAREARPGGGNGRGRRSAPTTTAPAASPVEAPTTSTPDTPSE